MARKAHPCLNRLAGAAVFLFFLGATGLGLELLCEYMWPNPYQWERRLIFYSEGTVFEDKGWGGFLYRPNARIHTEMYYITSLLPVAITKEYDYDIETNSDGLVQLRDISATRPSILFLGDSFTEGQGARPWFYTLERHWSDARYQVINGGILATGVESWEQLYRSLAAKAKVQKVVIIFISEDWIRPLFQFPPQMLDCLEHAARCTGHELFHPLSGDAAADLEEAQRVALQRRGYLLRPQHLIEQSVMLRKLLIPAYQNLSKLVMGVPTRMDVQFDRSEKAIQEIATQLGPGNLLFIHLPQKDEVDSGPNFLGKMARDFIRQNGFAFVDGFEKCGLTAADFLIHDGHPNAQGYGKISACVESAVAAHFDVR